MRLRNPKYFVWWGIINAAVGIGFMEIILQSRNKREKEIKKFVYDDIKNTNMDSMYQKGIDRCMIS
jgi:hypothetical protein